MVAEIHGYESYFFAVVMFGAASLAPAHIHRLLQAFGRLSAWERVNVMYRVCEALEGQMALVRGAFTRVARAADDRVEAAQALAEEVLG